MKRRIFLTLIITALLLGMTACGPVLELLPDKESVRGSGQVVEEYRPVENILRVELDMQGTLYLEQGGGELLRVDAEDNLQHLILSEMVGNTLVIKTEEGVELDNREPIKFYLVVKDLQGVEVNSSGDVKAGELESENLELNLNSSGSMSIASLDVTSLRVNLNSSGGLEIRGGQVEQQDITLSSSSDYHAEDLASLDALVSLNSSGSAYIRVSDQLSGSLSSSGDVYYSGSPQVDVSTSSSGKVEQVEE